MQSFWKSLLKYDDNYLHMQLLCIIYTCVVSVANKTNIFTSGDLKTIVLYIRKSRYASYCTTNDANERFTYNTNVVCPCRGTCL